MSGPEVEIKLILAPSHVASLETSPELELARSTRRTRRLLSTYYDTPDDQLSRHGLHLRVRETGGSWIQTVKSTRAGLARGEWEQAIASSSPVAHMGDGSPADDLLARRKIVSALAPAFRVDVQRTTWDVKLPRADIEVALDLGHVAAGDAREDVCEVELELKDGDGDTLFDLARRLRASAPVRLTLLSKGRRGYRLRSEKSGEPEKASIPPLELGRPAAAGGRAILMANLASLLLNLSLLAAKSGPVLVHQTRVALRRVRAALTLLGPILDEADADAVRTRLGELSGHLGAARDLDVFLETGCDSIAEDVRETVRAHATARQEKAYAALAADINSDAHFELMLAVLRLAETGGEADSEITLGAFAAKALDRRLRKLVKSSRKLHKLGNHERHRVRIRAKKLRYMIEFFEAGAPGRGFRRMRDTLESLQETLGELNDVVVARAFAEDAVAAAGVSGQVPQLVAAMPARRRERLDKARAARRELARLKPFWKAWKV